MSFIGKGPKKPHFLLIMSNSPRLIVQSSKYPYSFPKPCVGWGLSTALWWDALPLNGYWISCPWQGLTLLTLCCNQGRKRKRRSPVGFSVPARGWTNCTNIIVESSQLWMMKMMSLGKDLTRVSSQRLPLLGNQMCMLLTLWDSGMTAEWPCWTVWAR